MEERVRNLRREDEDHEDKVRRTSVEGRDDEDRGDPGQGWKSEC